jgi:nucleotide-binding universal stress UspA family protein
MAFQVIVVPTDFSPTSEAALHYAARLALTLNARLYLVHVPGKTGENFEAGFPIGAFDRHAHTQLASFLTTEELERLHPDYAERIGTPAEEIVRFADARDADLIVMGTHGRTGLAHLVMGSVAEHVVRAAPCPVLLVRSSKPVSTATPGMSVPGKAAAS